MIETLKRVMEQAEQLEPDRQQQLAEQMQQCIDAIRADALWDKLLRDPQKLDVLHRMAQEAIEEYHRGETEEGGFGA